MKVFTTKRENILVYMLCHLIMASKCFHNKLGIILKLVKLIIDSHFVICLTVTVSY